MRAPAPLTVEPFGSDDSLSQIGESVQIGYLHRYLNDLGAKTIIAEPYYFDRDYLAEFSAFYATSAAGYENVCKRLHFFAETFGREALDEAVEGENVQREMLAASYLGFVVVRPIPGSPLGRTVLAWYPDRELDTTPRVVSPSRDYRCHVAGLELVVGGLAWQQQDMAVGACATIALWSMLHSSALDGQHALPTTASVTRSAHRTASLGSRVFPSEGLTIEQLCEAIKEHSLQPIVVPGDLSTGRTVAFSQERFAASCAALVRSGFPALITGVLRDQTTGEIRGGHAMCLVGFRSAPPPIAAPGTCVQHDANIPVVYVHDDNIGPSVRFAVNTDSAGRTCLRPSPPTPVASTNLPDPVDGYPEFVPGNLVIAVPADLRASPDPLNRNGLRVAGILSRITAHVLGEANSSQQVNGISVSSRFCRLRDYLSHELTTVLPDPSKQLGRTRLRLVEEVPPMSLYLGVVRLGDGATPLLDILYDTTDSEPNSRAFAHVVFEDALSPFLELFHQISGIDLGRRLATN